MRKWGASRIAFRTSFAKETLNIEVRSLKSVANGLLENPSNCPLCVRLFKKLKEKNFHRSTQRKRRGLALGIRFSALHLNFSWSVLFSIHSSDLLECGSRLKNGTIAREAHPGMA